MCVLLALLVALLFVTVLPEALDIRSLNENVLPTDTTPSNLSLTTTQEQVIENIHTTLVHVHSGKHNQTLTRSEYVPIPTNASSTLGYWQTVKLYTPVVTRGVWLTSKFYRPLLLTRGFGITKRIKVPLSVHFHRNKIELETDAPTYMRTKGETGSNSIIDMGLFNL